MNNSIMFLLTILFHLLINSTKNNHNLKTTVYINDNISLNIFQKVKVKSEETTIVSAPLLYQAYIINKDLYRELTKDLEENQKNIIDFYIMNMLISDNLKKLFLSNIFNYNLEKAKPSLKDALKNFEKTLQDPYIQYIKDDKGQKVLCLNKAHFQKLGEAENSIKNPDILVNMILENNTNIITQLKIQKLKQNLFYSIFFIPLAYKYNYIYFIFIFTFTYSLFSK